MLGVTEYALIVSVIGLFITLISFMNGSKKNAAEQERRLTKLEDTVEHNKNVISEMKSEIKTLEKYSDSVIRLETTMELFSKQQQEISKKLDRLIRGN